MNVKNKPGRLGKTVKKPLKTFFKLEKAQKFGGGGVLTSGKENGRIKQGFAKIILILKYYNECKDENDHRSRGVWL